MATEKGIVVKIDSGTARVRTSKSSGCASCSARHQCQATETSREMEVDAVNPVGAKVGDRILLYFETGSLLKATFLLYIFPILCMLLGAVLGHLYSLKNDLNPSAPSAAGGFLSLVLSYVFVRSRANKLAADDRYRPRIVKILRQHNF